MFIGQKEFVSINKTIQSEYQHSIASAARNSWVPFVATSTQGSGVEDVRQFLVETIKPRVGEGTEVFDLNTASVRIEHKMLSGSFVVQDRDLVSERSKEMILSAAKGLGESVELVKQQLLLEMINDPDAKAYDGIPFFAAGHYVNYKDSSNGTFDNAETSKDLTPDNLAAAIAAIEDRRMPDGTPRMLKAKWLLHAPALKKKAYDATGAKTTSNFVESTFGVVPLSVPGLAQVGGKDVWIVCAEHVTGGDALSRPFGISTLVEPRITDFSGITAPHLARMKQLEYVMAGDLTVYLGHPYLVHRCAVA